jgi:hypothetical protein
MKTKLVKIASKDLGKAVESFLWLVKQPASSMFISKNDEYCRAGARDNGHFEREHWNRGAKTPKR